MGTTIKYKAYTTVEVPIEGVYFSRVRGQYGTRFQRWDGHELLCIERRTRASVNSPTKHRYTYEISTQDYPTSTIRSEAEGKKILGMGVNSCTAQEFFTVYREAILAVQAAWEVFLQQGGSLDSPASKPKTIKAERAASK